MPKKETKVAKIAKAKAKPTKKTILKKAVVHVPSVKIAPEQLQMPRTSPKDVFLHLLMLVMLYLGVIGLITLVFAYVDYSFPDPLGYYYGSGLLSDVRWQSSMLMVSFPLLLVLSHFIQADFRKNPKKHELRFNKWLTYLTLFVTAITIVIDLMTLVNRFYGGELTTSFLLKVFWVLLVAGSVFGYYIWDVQSESYKSKIPNRVAWVSSVVVVGMLALGFILAGSPSHQREIRMDEQRVNHLTTIQDQLISYWQVKRELPSSLNELKNDLIYFTPPLDPETGMAYEYKVLDPLRFELCATFNQKIPSENPDSPSNPAYNYDYKYGYNADFWNHEAGRACFERTIDPKLYPEAAKLQ